MAYVEPVTRAAGYVIPASEWAQNTVDNPIALKALIDAVSPWAVSQSTTSTGTQNDFAITTGAPIVYLRANNASALTLTGFVAPTTAVILEIASVGAGQVNLSNLTGSTADNQIANGVTGTISLAAGSGRARLIYDLTTAKWRVLEHEQGAWITPAFAAGDFTIPGGAAWTVDVGDVTTYAYKISGKTLTVAWVIATSTVVTGGQRPAYIKIPGGFTVAKNMFAMGISVDNGGASVAGAIEVLAGETNIGVYPTQSPAATNWTAGVNNMTVRGQITFEVQ